LAGIICDNTDIMAVPSNAFLLTPKEQFINCDQTPKLENIPELLITGLD
jgi:hypothetical protein